jgi:hypothetical protein
MTATKVTLSALVVSAGALIGGAGLYVARAGGPAADPQQAAASETAETKSVAKQQGQPAPNPPGPSGTFAGPTGGFGGSAGTFGSGPVFGGAAGPFGLGVGGGPVYGGTMTMPGSNRQVGPLRFEGFGVAAQARPMTLLETESFIAVRPPGRNEIRAYSIAEGKWATYKVPEGVEATPLADNQVMALALKGESIAQVAVFCGDTWLVQELKEPAKGQITPMVAPGVVVYGSGRYVYALSDAMGFWGVLELPEGTEARARFGFGNKTLMVEDAKNNRLHIFNATVGRWDSTDLSAEAPKDR